MKKDSFVGGALIATSGIILTKILGIVFVIPFYAIIGISGGALYGYAYSIYAIFLNLTTVGIPLAMSRLTSEYDTLGRDDLKEQTFKLGKLIVSVLGIVSFILLMIFAEVIAKSFIGNIEGGNSIEDIAFVIRVISMALLVVPTLSVSRGYMQGHKFIKPTTISQVLEQIVRLTVLVIGSFVTIKVLNLDIKIGVGIATFAATIGAIASYIYIRFKMNKHKEEFRHKKAVVSKTDNKKIVKRIFSYAIPFIISSAIFSLYRYVDLITVVKTMVNDLGYSALEAESVISIFTTWGLKLNAIVIAVATGLATSLIPSITDSFSKKDYKSVSNKINKSIQIIIAICLPITVILSFISGPVWTFFYSYNVFNSSVFAFYIYVAIFNSVFTITNVIMQSLDKQKVMLKYLAVGLVIKIALTYPLMIGFADLNLLPSYGANLATIAGYFISTILMLNHLRKDLKVDFSETIKVLFKTIIYSGIMVALMCLVTYLVPLDVTGKLNSFVVSGIYTIIGFGFYILIAYKTGFFKNIIGENYSGLVNKLKLKK